ncbi:hypothetical protein AX774_g807 [Zancudomyces culisetae]|uniref:Uncharacterized protein n=1 Tax=Zancudomyces culisetae TaxID=1213189 RepID=A0A1R1PXL2_ZANCU|nr:hypothetical protein AX774_g807 [Zancudomyces culisetae]|eukprot:OMH85637.1 hypothetical protein AX774_g807 [Zancudomyces culisetae]
MENKSQEPSYYTSLKCRAAALKVFGENFIRIKSLDAGNSLDMNVVRNVFGINPKHEENPPKARNNDISRFSQIFSHVLLDSNSMVLGYIQNSIVTSEIDPQELINLAAITSTTNPQEVEKDEGTAESTATPLNTTRNVYTGDGEYLFSIVTVHLPKISRIRIVNTRHAFALGKSECFFAGENVKIATFSDFCKGEFGISQKKPTAESFNNITKMVWSENAQLPDLNSLNITYSDDEILMVCSQSYAPIGWIKIGEDEKEIDISYNTSYFLESGAQVDTNNGKDNESISLFEPKSLINVEYKAAIFSVAFYGLLKFIVPLLG